MPVKIIRYVIFFLAAVILFGCKKDPVTKNESGQIIVQGNITLKVRAMHHWWGVSYLPIYLKKNATEWPGPDSTKYEFHVDADNEGYCEFTHLFPGSYYVYAHGYDPFFGMNVIGHTPVQLNAGTAPNHELSITLTVSE